MISLDYFVGSLCRITSLDHFARSLCQITSLDHFVGAADLCGPFVKGFDLSRNIVLLGRLRAAGVCGPYKCTNTQIHKYKMYKTKYMRKSEYSD